MCSSTPTSATGRLLAGNSIGDTVWLDANRDGARECGAGHPGRAGAVDLVREGRRSRRRRRRDLHHRHRRATASTCSRGLPDGNFEVTTNLASNIGAGGPLEGLFATYDATAPADGISTVTGHAAGTTRPDPGLRLQPVDGTGATRGSSATRSSSTPTATARRTPARGHPGRQGRPGLVRPHGVR